MLIVDVFSSDPGAPDEERRKVNDVVWSPHTNRIVVLEVSGGASICTPACISPPTTISHASGCAGTSRDRRSRWRASA